MGAGGGACSAPLPCCRFRFFTIWQLVMYISSSDVMYAGRNVSRDSDVCMQEIVDQKLSARVEDLLTPIGINVSLYLFCLCRSVTILLLFAVFSQFSIPSH